MTNPPLVLQVGGPPGKIKVWWDQAKTSEVPLGTAFINNNEIPSQGQDLWVEGVETSDSVRDLELILICVLGGKAFEDRIKFTVFDVTIEKCPFGFLPMGGPEDNTVPITAYISPDDLEATMEFTLFGVSSEPGYCLNRPADVPGSGEDSDAWWDLQFQEQTGFTITGSDNEIATTDNPVSSATVDVDCYDYGAYGKIMAKAQIGGVWHIADDEDDENEYVRIPYDENENNIADCATLHNDGPANEDDESLGSPYTGDGLTRYEEYRGVDINYDLKVSGAERTNPNYKDLFVKGNNFGGSLPDFAWGNAFAEAEITVHEFTGMKGVDDRNIDILVVTASNASCSSWADGGHIERRSAPFPTGERNWCFAIPGESHTGTATLYGCDVGYTRVYITAVNYYFSDKPHLDNNTWTAPGVWGGAANGVLDPVSPERVEDPNDDGVLDANEKDGDASAPHDDGDHDFDGDYPVKSGGSWACMPASVRRTSMPTDW